MPNYVAVGSEFVVNNVTLYTQSRADFARLTSGHFVAVWESTDGQQDASSSGIKGRLMAADGTPVGPEFLVNTATAGGQSRPDVAGLADGGFVVTWTTFDAIQDGSYDAIKAQRFDATGAKVGPEFLVNSQTSNIQWISSVASLDNGGFVIAWETYDSAQDGSGRAIKAQLFDASGAKTGGEFLVNTITADQQLGAEISSLSDGRFIVTWHTQIFGKLEVRAQVFDSAGAKLGGEIFVNTHTAESQTETNVTRLANGGFVITWTTFDTTQDGSGNAIKAQLFDAAGAKVGGEILVNTAGAASQKTPSVAGLSNGDFVIAWRTDDQTADDASGAIKAQLFDSAGAKLGGEFRVNSSAATIESEPVVVDLGNGAFAIGWTGSSAPSYDSNIRAQIFSSGSAPVIQSDGGGATASLILAEGETAVTIVHAVDIDGPAISYSIAGGVDAALFAIDASTGALAFVAAPNFEAPTDAGANNVYDVVVAASDGAHSDTQAIAVTVGNVNEPVTINSNGGGATAAVSIAENASAVATVAASDADGAAVTYAIAGGSDAARFTINAATGALAFVAAPNFEAPSDTGANNVYDVIVSACDGAFSDSQAIAVTVTNVMEGNVITGTGAGDTIATTKTVAGQPFATQFEDTIYGLGGADTLMGGGGADIIDGGAGNDLIYGNAGADRLTGGIGADRFALKLTTDSQVGAPDVIVDFSRSQGDRIGLSDIDAKTNAGGNNSFVFIGTAAFSGVAGQLRYEQVGGNTFVTGDVNGDRVADFQIQLNGLIALTSTDFIL